MAGKGNVLIVDDEESSRALVCGWLVSADYACTEAADGEEGLRLLLNNDFDVVLADYKMPVMDGIEMLRRMGEMELPTIPIIFSGFGQIVNVVEAMRIGAFDFVEKPAGRNVVEGAVDRAMLHSRLNRQARGYASLADQLESIFDATPDLFIVLDDNLRLMRCNQALAYRLGRDRSELIGLRGDQLCSGDDDTKVLLPFLDLGGESSFHSRPLFHRDWEAHYEVTRAPLLDRNGEKWGAVIIAHDASESYRLQMQLNHAQKMESIGQLAAGIAHEINTPTQYLSDNTHFLQDSFGALFRLLDAYEQLLSALENDAVGPALLRKTRDVAGACDVAFLREEIPKAIADSLEGLARVTEIIKAMKEFSHPGTTEKTLSDIHELIRSTVLVARNEWKYVAEVETDFDEELPLVPCLPGEFNQAVLNILVNAAYAIGQKIGHKALGKGTIKICTKREGNYAEIRISDSGTGIPQKIQGRIFDPFFTTKEVGKGTGQGMPIAYSAIVDKHDGELTFVSEEGKGTTFIIRLPLTET